MADEFNPYVYGTDIVSSPFLPENTVLLMNNDPRAKTFGWSIGEMSIRKDPWGPAIHRPPPPPPDASDERKRMAEVAQWERLKALRYLEGRLDDSCRRLGWDPEVVWRRPKIAERRSRWLHYMIEERIGLLINPPEAVIKVTP